MLIINILQTGGKDHWQKSISPSMVTSINLPDRIPGPNALKNRIVEHHTTIGNRIASACLYPRRTFNKSKGVILGMRDMGFILPDARY